MINFFFCNTVLKSHLLRWLQNACFKGERVQTESTYVTLPTPFFLTTVSCVNEIGYEYNGYLSTTSSNTHCLRWDSLSTPYPDSSFIDGSAEKAENFCREPTLLDARPWCYVSGLTREYCNIGFCKYTTVQSIRLQTPAFVFQ